MRKWTLSLEGLHPALFHGPVARAPVVAPRYNVFTRIGQLLELGTRQQALQVRHIAVSSRFILSVLHEAADLLESGENRRLVASTLAELLLNALHVKRVNLPEELGNRAG